MADKGKLVADIEVNAIEPYSVSEPCKEVPNVEERGDKDNIEFPAPVDYPIAERIKELKLDEMTEDPDFYNDLKQKDLLFYKNMKNLPDSVVKKYIPDIARRFIELERRIKKMENLLWALPREERSLEEDRFEILTELLDKACQGFDIWDEHAERNIRLSHRIVLESRLLHLISTKFDIITKVCEEFDKLKGNTYEVSHERDWLRYEIRHCDMVFTELHEQFLKSYLDMDW